MDKEYFAFISYKSEDVEWAIWLQHELEHYHLPASFNGRSDVRQELRPVFRDIDELSAGNLPEQIQQALARSQNLIVVCSPQAAASPWVNQEIETFIALGKTNQIFPFIVEGNSPAESFPPALLNLPKEEERLGGDVSKKGRDAAFIKVVAGMLGVGFDSLWNRYEKEKAEEERLQREQRDNLLRVQSRFVAEKAQLLTDNGDSYLARKLLLEVLPKDIDHPDRPLTIEAEKAFISACQHNSAILYIKGKNNSTYSASFSPDGKFIISALRLFNESYESTKTIRIWDAQTGQEISKMGSIEDYISSAVFSPDGTHIVSGSFIKNNIIIWDALTGKEIKRLEGHTNWVRSVAFSYDGRHIVSASKDKTIKIWDLLTGELLRNIEGHTDNVNSANFSPDGKHIVSASYDKSIRIWDALTGREVNRLIGHTGWVNSANYSPDGRYIVSASNDKTIRIWDALTGREINKLEGHTGEVHSANYSPDGMSIVSASHDMTSKIWDAQNGQAIKTLDCSPKFKGIESSTRSVYSAGFKPDGKCIVLTTGLSIRLWDTTMNFETKIMRGHTECVRSARFSPDGKRIVSSSWDNSVRVWDVISNKEINRLEGHIAGVYSASFSPDGQRIVSASEDKTIRIWDAMTGREVNRLVGHTNSVLSASYSPDGERIVSGSTDETIRIWDTQTGQEVNRLEGHTSFVNSVAFSPDGKRIVSAANEIRIWDALTGQQINRIEVHTCSVDSVAFSPDGKYIISASGSSGYLMDLDDHTIIIWDAQTGKEINRLEGHKDWVNSVALSPDGKRIVSTAVDDTVRIWDTQKGLEIYTLECHMYKFISAEFSPDGKCIVLASSDGTVRIWDFPPLQELIDETRERFKDCPLTPEERQKYYLD